MNSEALAARIENLLGSALSGSGERIPSRPPPPIPDHEIFARIGGGSYGEVWLARSITGALRAIKVVWRSHFSSERPYEREFHGIVKFEPISRSHPGVVNVLHVGRDDAAGCFFYVMELADAAGEKVISESVISKSVPKGPVALASSGSLITSYEPRTLASELKSRTRVPVTDAVSLGVQLAGALGHLHRHGLVHRDVKPSNVIFVNGQAKLADIGLVTGIHEERSFVGTEGFIPPEGPGSERADLFALGRLLYEASTGKNRCDFPGLPDDLDRWPKNEREGLIELNEVLARACAPEAKKRHSNAADLAGDLNLILAGRSVRRAYGTERQLRRATWISVAALTLVLLAVSSNWLQRRQRELSETQAKRETALREETQKSLARAETAEQESQKQLYTALLEQVRATVLSGEMGQRVRALDALRRAAAISNSVELRREVFAALALPDLRFDRELPLGEKFVVKLDPSFERIALAVLRGRGPVEIRSTSDQRLLATLSASTNLPVYVMEWSADGRFLAVKRDHPPSGMRADWEIWETANWRQILLRRDLPLGAVAFHPRLPRVFLGQRNGAAIWDLESGTEVSRFSLAGTPFWLRLAPDGERFAALYEFGGGGKASVHEVANPSGAPLASHAFAARLSTCNWHPSGWWIALPDFSGNVNWMDAQTGETRVLGRHKAEAVRAEFSPDGAYMISGAWSGELICWDVQTLQRAFNIRLNGFVGQFRADGRAYAVETRSGVQLHAFERPSGHREFAEDLGTRLEHAAFSSDGRWLVASADKRMGVWDFTVNGPGALDEKGQDAHCFFTPDGRELFGSRSRDGKRTDAFRWRIAPATNIGGPPRLEPLRLYKPPGFTFLSLNSNSVVMTSTNGTQILAPEETDAGKKDWTRTPAGMNRPSPDGRWVGIFAPRSPSLYVHRLPDLKHVVKLTHPANISHFEFSPLGDEVTLSSDRSVELWNTATWERTRLLTNFTRPFLYAPDGRSLWLTKDQHAAGLYDARTLEPHLLLPAGMLPLAVSPDGRRIAVSVNAQRLQVWDLTALREQFRALGMDWAEQ